MDHEAIKALRFQKMAEEIEDYAIILLDEHGNIENWNRGAEKIKGYKAEEVIGRNFRIFYTEAARASGHPERLIAEARAKGKATDEHWRVRKDGSLFCGSVLITAIHDAHGNVIGFTKVTRDLTHQKEQEESLRKSEERYHQMVDQVENYAILRMDPNGSIESWNTGAERIKGYKAEEIIGKSFKLFYTESDRQAQLPEQLLEEALRTGRVQHEGWRIRKDGSLFWGNVTITALRDQDGKLTGFSKVTRDLTDRIQMEALRKIEARNKELEQFTYVASHDLQEPVRTILGFVEVLKEEYAKELDGPGHQYLDIITQLLDRMLHMIQELLTYSRIGHNRTMEQVNCNEVVADVLLNLDAAIRECGATINVASLPVVKGNKVELHQLFQNLLGNALKFRQPGRPPVIFVRAAQESGHWLLEVQDNGIGIAPQYYERIFMVFQRLHHGEDYPGAGIGLAHCKKIVELHNGAMWVRSEPGEGSTFSFTLPQW